MYSRMGGPGSGEQYGAPEQSTGAIVRNTAVLQQGPSVLQGPGGQPPQPPPQQQGHITSLPPSSSDLSQGPQGNVWTPAPPGDPYETDYSLVPPPPNVPIETDPSAAGSGPGLSSPTALNALPPTALEPATSALLTLDDPANPNNSSAASDHQLSQAQSTDYRG